MASVSSSVSLPKFASKASFRDPSGFDLFYQLIYMSAVASAGVSRPQMFQLASKLLRPPAEYFRRIYLLCEKLGYNYPAACNLVGRKTKAEAMRSFLLRFADALSSGHPEVSFLTQEAQIQREAYEKEYDRNLASLSKWADAYGAIIVSSALIIIVNLTSTMIYDLGTAMIAGLVVTAIMAGAGGAWIISRAAPTEPEATFTAEGTPAQRLVLRLVKIVPLATLGLCLPLGLLGLDMGWLLLLAGLAMFPLGVVTLRATAEVERKDREIGPFLRSLGVVAVSTGSTLAAALSQVDASSFPNLQPDLKRLGWRFEAAIAPALCWRKFGHETGSNLIRSATTVFYDAVKLGGDADMVGSLCSQFATTEVMLRARRRVVASTFANLTIVMHGAVATLMVLMLEVINHFTEFVARTGTGVEAEGALRSIALPMFGFGSPMLGTLGTLTYAMVIVLALVNAFAIVGADGGHILKGSFYLSILLAVSGIVLLAAPPIAAAILT